MIKWREGTREDVDMDLGWQLMAWMGNTVSAHVKKGHHPRPRYKVKTVNGRKVQVPDRYVCDCGATLRR